jgi:PAS domain S-box-containing protein
MVYTLAMASSDGSKFPPLSRRLNDREREQLRISQMQQRHFRSNSTLAVAVGKNGQEQRRSNINTERRRQDREYLFRAIGEDQEMHGSMAYSLSMAMDLEESDFLPLTRSLKNNTEKERLGISRDQVRHDRMVATKQLYGHRTIGNEAASIMTGDDIDLDVDAYDNDDLSMAYSLSFASSLDEGSVEFPSLTRSLNERESSQLRISRGQLVSKCTYPEQHRRQQHPLPRTLQDALLPSSEAIVITETKMPFRVFNVNSAWEGLCGYSHVESKGKSLGSLLGGKETDACAVTALIHQLFVHGEEATTVLTNYTKEGRKFRNRLSVGPLYDEETNEVSHFVGVLREVAVAA